MEMRENNTREDINEIVDWFKTGIRGVAKTVRTPDSNLFVRSFFACRCRECCLNLALLQGAVTQVMGRDNLHLKHGRSHAVPPGRKRVSYLICCSRIIT
jgi:hypothetical protein